VVGSALVSTGSMAATRPDTARWRREFIARLLARLVAGARRGRLLLLVVLGRGMRAVALDCQLVDLSVDGVVWLVVLVVDAGERVGTHVEVLVPLQDQRDGALHGLPRDLLAVDLEHALAAAADPADAVEGERADAEPVIGEGELERVLARGERVL